MLKSNQGFCEKESGDLGKMIQHHQRKKNWKRNYGKNKYHWKANGMRKPKTIASQFFLEKKQQAAEGTIYNLFPPIQDSKVIMSMPHGTLQVPCMLRVTGKQQRGHSHALHATDTLCRCDSQSHAGRMSRNEWCSCEKVRVKR